MNRGTAMGRVAYKIEDAAKATGTEPNTVALAIRDDQLTAYRIDGQAIILHDDLTRWVQSHPRF